MFARNGSIEQLRRWFALEGVCYTPITNFKGVSALEDAIWRQERATAKELWENLTVSLNETTAPLMTNTIRLLAKRMPTLVGPLLIATDQTLVRVEATFRTTLKHALVTSSKQLQLTESQGRRVKSRKEGEWLKKPAAVNFVILVFDTR